MTWLEAYRFKRLNEWEPPWGVTFEAKFCPGNGDMWVVMRTRDGTVADMSVVGPIDRDLFRVLDNCADYLLLTQRKTATEREKALERFKGYACVRRARGNRI